MFRCMKTLHCMCYQLGIICYQYFYLGYLLGVNDDCYQLGAAERRKSSNPARRDMHNKARPQYELKDNITPGKHVSHCQMKQKICRTWLLFHAYFLKSAINLWIFPTICLLWKALCIFVFLMMLILIVFTVNEHFFDYY